MRCFTRPRFQRWPALVALCTLGCGLPSEPTPGLAHPPAYGAAPIASFATGDNQAPLRSANPASPATTATTATTASETVSGKTTTSAPGKTATSETAPDKTTTGALLDRPGEIPSDATKPPSFDPGLANLNPEDDTLVAPPEAIVDCEARLKAAGVTFRTAKLPLIRQRGSVCGAPQVVEYIDGPEHIRFRPRPLVTCQLALALAHFERVIQRSAMELLSAKVTSVTQGGTYNCRPMARFRLVSEHSYANAIDLYAFGLSDARTLSVVKHFGDPKKAPSTAEGRFLRILAQRLFDEDVFSVVVTRYFDELHRDHIHADMAHYRTDGTR